MHNAQKPDPVKCPFYPPRETCHPHVLVIMDAVNFSNMAALMKHVGQVEAATMLQYYLFASFILMHTCMRYTYLSAAVLPCLFIQLGHNERRKQVSADTLVAGCVTCYQYKPLSLVYRILVTVNVQMFTTVLLSLYSLMRQIH